MCPLRSSHVRPQAKFLCHGTDLPRADGVEPLREFATSLT